MAGHNKIGKMKFWVSLGALAILLTIKQFPLFIENYYIPYVYTPLTQVLSFFFGWLPFSFGDLIYVLLFLWLIIGIYRFIKNKKYKTFSQTKFINVGVNILLISIIFNFIWGVTYNRLSFQQKIKLATPQADSSTIKAFYLTTINKLNSLAVGIDSNKIFDPLSMKNELNNAYQNLSKVYPSLAHRNHLPKPSMFSTPLSYMGFHGYYNPLTSEAQLNDKIPHFFKPIVTLHEMAHQLGYAQEDQANFVGFLAAEHSTDTAIQYSYHFDLMLYSSSEVFALDSNLVRSQQQLAHPLLKKHLREWRQFRVTHKSWATRISEWFYNKFLQVNATSKGVASYNDGLHHIIAWRKSVGRIQ